VALKSERKSRFGVVAYTTSTATALYIKIDWQSGISNESALEGEVMDRSTRMSLTGYRNLTLCLLPRLQVQSPRRLSQALPSSVFQALSSSIPARSMLLKGMEVDSSSISV